MRGKAEHSEISVHMRSPLIPRLTFCSRVQLWRAKVEWIIEIRNLSNLQSFVLDIVKGKLSPQKMIKSFNHEITHQ